MSIPRQQIEQVLDAGHPETALIGVPVSLLRELFRAAVTTDVNVVSRGVGRVIGTNAVLSVGGRHVG